MAQRAKRTTIALWLLAGLLAALYLMAGASKLAGAERHVQGFAHWGWPDWLRIVVGAVEVASAVMLLIPRTAFLGAASLVVVMGGATYTHLFRAEGEGGMAAATLVLMGLAALVTYARRPGALRVSRTSGATREL